MVISFAVVHHADIRLYLLSCDDLTCARKPLEGDFEVVIANANCRTRRNTGSAARDESYTLYLLDLVRTI